MKRIGLFGLISFFSWFGVVPASGHDCRHHGDHSGYCWDCGGHYYRPNSGPQSGRPWRGRGPASLTANLETVEGKIAEVVYLPGPTASSGMVEIRMQSANRTTLIRLAPSGFLKEGGLLLREGDAIAVTGFRVSGMEGDLLVATEVRKGDKSLPLRDADGRPAW